MKFNGTTEILTIGCENIVLKFCLWNKNLVRCPCLNWWSQMVSIYFRYKTFDVSNIRVWIQILGGGTQKTSLLEKELQSSPNC